MTGYTYLVVKLTSTKSDAKKDKPKYSVVDVVPVGIPSAHREKFEPYAYKTIAVKYVASKTIEYFNIKVEYVHDKSTSLALVGSGEDAEDADKVLSAAVDEITDELRGNGQNVSSEWVCDSHNLFQGVILRWADGCIWIDMTPVAMKPSAAYSGEIPDLHQERSLGQDG